MKESGSGTEGIASPGLAIKEEHPKACREHQERGIKLIDGQRD